MTASGNNIHAVINALLCPSQGSVVVDFVLVVNKKTSSEIIKSTLIEAAIMKNLSLSISPDDIRLSGKSSAIDVLLSVIVSSSNCFKHYQ